MGLRELYAIELGNVSSMGDGYGGTREIVGVGAIVALHLVAGRLDATPLPGAVSFLLYWTDVVPTSLATLQVGEHVFGECVGPSNVLGLLTVSSDGGGVVVEGPFLRRPKGRRLSVRVYNNGPESVSVALFMVWERGDVSAEELAARERGVGSGVL